VNEIEVHVAELEQFFDHMDASPLATRNLDPRAERFIVDAAKDLPLLSLQEQFAAAKDQRIPLHLQIDPGLNLSLVVLYLDADKQRMGHEVLQANRNTYITITDCP